MTELQKSILISKALGINLYIKRDDLYPLPGGGNKARKLDHILTPQVREKYNALVTAGGNRSNHVRAAALMAARLGWKSVMLIHDKRPSVFTGNLLVSKLAGAELRFVSREDVADAMDKAMEDLKEQGYSPLYIWGGGHCVEGALAYYHAVDELRGQLGGIIPECIVAASGTGTTQAGLEVGVRKFLPGCRVMGVSIAHDAKRGKEDVLASAGELIRYLHAEDLTVDDVFFDDGRTGGGYGTVTPGLIETIKWAARTEGLLLDPTYTGKAFQALVAYIEKGLVRKQSDVVFWHTGGLLNLVDSVQIA